MSYEERRDARKLQRARKTPEISEIIEAFYITPEGRNGLLSDAQVDALRKKFELHSADDVARFKIRIKVGKMKEDEIRDLLGVVRHLEKDSRNPVWSEVLNVSSQGRSKEELDEAIAVREKVLERLEQIERVMYKEMLAQEKEHSHATPRDESLVETDTESDGDDEGEEDIDDTAEVEASKRKEEQHAEFERFREELKKPKPVSAVRAEATKTVSDKEQKRKAFHGKIAEAEKISHEKKLSSRVKAMAQRVKSVMTKKTDAQITMKAAEVLKAMHENANIQLSSLFKGWSFADRARVRRVFYSQALLQMKQIAEDVKKSQNPTDYTKLLEEQKKWAACVASWVIGGQMTFPVQKAMSVIKEKASSAKAKIEQKFTVIKSNIDKAVTDLKTARDAKKEERAKKLLRMLDWLVDKRENLKDKIDDLRQAALEKINSLKKESEEDNETMEIGSPENVRHVEGHRKWSDSKSPHEESSEASSHSKSKLHTVMPEVLTEDDDMDVEFSVTGSSDDEDPEVIVEAFDAEADDVVAEMPNAKQVEPVVVAVVGGKKDSASLDDLLKELDTFKDIEGMEGWSPDNEGTHDLLHK